MSRSPQRSWERVPAGIPAATRRHRRGAWRSTSVLFALLMLAACSTANRPAWERSAIPSASKSTAGATPTVPGSVPTTAAQPARAPLGSSVQRTVLPPPAAASAQPASATPAKPATAATSSTTAAATVPAAIVPTGAPGKAVAVATPSAQTPKATVDPLWTGVETHIAKHEDTLLDLAVDHGIGFIELAMANPGVDPWLPGDGTMVVLPKQHLPPDGANQGIVINLPEQRLYYYEKGKLLRSYPIGIGRDGHATPTGRTSIVRKQANPTWYPTPSARHDDPTLPVAMPPGPDNPLGNRAIYLGWSSYLIHGTNKEYGIGRRASRGCIRMYSDDAIALFDRVAVGTPVTVVDQPVKVGWLQDELYIEASPTMQQVQQWEEDGKLPPADAVDVRDLITRKAGKAIDRVDWSVVDRAVAERRGILTRITRPVAAQAIASSAAPQGTSVATGSSTAAVIPTKAISAPTGPAVAPPVAATTTTAAATPTAPTLTPPKPTAQTASTAEAAVPHTGGDDLVKWLRGRLSATGAPQ